MLTPTDRTIIIIVCPDHEGSGKRFARYLVVGKTWYNAPNLYFIQSMMELHRDWPTKAVLAFCKQCKSS